MELSKLTTILYVEDDDDIRVVGEMALNIGGWKVVACASGVEAIENALSLQPDLVVLDVMMPVMDGPSTLNKMRSDPVTAKTPVIFMTAKIQKSEIEHYIQIGAMGVISKPFDPLTLHQEIIDLWIAN